jgi:hypothetical protein
MGARVFIPWISNITLAAGDRLVVSFSCIGRAVR